ncbi:MAG: hypothetical protein AB7F09_06565 [Parvibaculaceae bacterium]
MSGGKRQVVRKSQKVTHLYTQAERARKLAGECGSRLVADLYELHANICEQNARLKRPRRRST